MYKLLIVDDELANLRLLERLFRHDYYCLVASSGAEAIQLLEQHEVAIVITDQRMPEMTGIDLLKRTAELRPHMVRILLTGYTDVEALVEAVNCGLVYMYISKPWKNEDLKEKVAEALGHYENNRKHQALKVANERLEARFGEMKLGFVSALSEVLKAKDEYQYEHGFRVSTHAVAIAERMDLSEEDRADVAAAALLHGLGHIGTPERLLATAPAAADEIAVFREYVERGARMLAPIPELRNVADIIRFHCENFDGTGYPRGLGGEQIPLVCRIVRVAAQYESLTHPRDLSAAISPEDATTFLWDHAGREFDPRVVGFVAGRPGADLFHLDADQQASLEVEWSTQMPGEVAPELIGVPH
jgi:response regulator RpfG family c-di-GMP phosphodiesterase